MEEEKGLPTYPPSTMPEDPICLLTTAFLVSAFGAVRCECAGVGEGRELTKESHVQLCSGEFTALSPVALQRVRSECGAAPTIHYITPTPITEKLGHQHGFLSLQVLPVGADILDRHRVHH